MLSRDFSIWLSMETILIPLLSPRIDSACLVVSFHVLLVSGLWNNNNNNWLVGELSRLTVAISSGMLFFFFFNTKPSSSVGLAGSNTLPVKTEEEARFSSCFSLTGIYISTSLTSVVGDTGVTPGVTGVSPQEYVEPFLLCPIFLNGHPDSSRSFSARWTIRSPIPDAAMSWDMLMVSSVLSQARILRMITQNKIPASGDSFGIHLSKSGISNLNHC